MKHRMIIVLALVGSVVMQVAAIYSQGNFLLGIDEFVNGAVIVLLTLALLKKKS